MAIVSSTTCQCLLGSANTSQPGTNTLPDTRRITWTLTVDQCGSSWYEQPKNRRNRYYETSNVTRGNHPTLKPSKRYHWIAKGCVHACPSDRSHQ